MGFSFLPNGSNDHKNFETHLLDQVPGLMEEVRAYILFSLGIIEPGLVVCPKEKSIIPWKVCGHSPLSAHPVCKLTTDI